MKYYNLYFIRLSFYDDYEMEDVYLDLIRQQHERPTKSAILVSTKMYSPTKYARLSKEVLGILHFGILFKRNSYLKPVFDEVIFKIIENGIVAKWEKQFFNFRTYEELADVASPQLTLAQFVGAFVFIFVFNCVGVLVFLIECAWYRVKLVRGQQIATEQLVVVGLQTFRGIHQRTNIGKSAVPETLRKVKLRVFKRKRGRFSREIGWN